MLKPSCRNFFYLASLWVYPGSLLKPSLFHLSFREEVDLDDVMDIELDFPELDSDSSAQPLKVSKASSSQPVCSLTSLGMFEDNYWSMFKSNFVKLCWTLTKHNWSDFVLHFVSIKLIFIYLFFYVVGILPRNSQQDDENRCIS